MSFFSKNPGDVGKEGYMIRRLGALEENERVKVVRADETFLTLESVRNRRKTERIRRGRCPDYVVFHPKESTFRTAENPTLPQVIAFPFSVREK